MYELVVYEVNSRTKQQEPRARARKNDWENAQEKGR